MKGKGQGQGQGRYTGYLISAQISKPDRPFPLLVNYRARLAWIYKPNCQQSELKNPIERLKCLQSNWTYRPWAPIPHCPWKWGISAEPRVQLTPHGWLTGYMTFTRKSEKPTGISGEDFFYFFFNQDRLLWNVPN